MTTASFALVVVRTLMFGGFALCCSTGTAGYAEDLLDRESDYIVDCSYTQWARNKDTHNWEADAYGCLNNVRLAGDTGPDWVVTSENAVAIIGLMQATRLLRDDGREVEAKDAVVKEFFQNWLKWKRQPIVADGEDAGGVVDRVFYDQQGKRTKLGDANAGSTGIMMVAMYKRYEFLRDTNRQNEANEWLANKDAWRIMRDGFKFIKKNYNPTHKMVRSRAGQNDLWLTDATLCACGIKCFHEWAKKSERSPEDSNTLFENIRQGVVAMKDLGDWKNFYRYREAAKDFSPGYGDRVDQICFLPYESGLLPADDRFAQEISDWWTNGSKDSPKMTFQTEDPTNWRYYGTKWKHFFAGDPETNHYLYPGPSLQLAKMEWRVGKASKQKSISERANHRYAFSNNKSYSNLWFGASGESEAGVPNGIVDWRDANDAKRTAAKHERFIDTSSYLIQVTLMVFFDRDTSHLPN
jgi:hypothetical protein